jgi:hypothetical protein
MSIPLRLLIGLLACMFFALAHSQVTPLCRYADARCTEWVPLDNDQRGLIYRTFALNQRNEGVEHAVIAIHGQGRNADGYFRHALAGAFLADALQNTLVVSPRFASNEGGSCRDKLDSNEVGWICLGPASWRSGGEQATPATKKLNSFDFMDAIVSRLSDRNVFPNLRTIVIAGHSAGGQYVGRYQMANRLHENLRTEKNIQITYVIGNPSSYTYPDALRPTRSAIPANISAAAPGYMPVPSVRPQTPFAAYADAGGCTNFNSWPYGLENKVGAARDIPNDQLKERLATRPVTFLLGELDILPLYGFDSSCAAMAQGPTRLARGFAFASFVNEMLKSKHSAVMVPACGHDARCMFSAEKALPYLFVR